MRAGNLDRAVVIQAFNSARDDYGQPVASWSEFARVRAEIIQGSTDEYFAAAGVEATSTIVFRIRYLSGVTTAHRVVYDGRNFNIDEIREIGRHRGLELRGKAAE